MRGRDRRSRRFAFALALALPWAAPSARAALEFGGGVTAIALRADDSRIRDDATASVDLTLARTTERGQLFVYVEASSSLDEDRVSSLLAESNADAGSALDFQRRGRVQLSELNYGFDGPGEGRLTFGLVDASSYLDRTRITNDENVQFLGASFVNNPTIEFPDYTLGAVYQLPSAGRRPQINAVLTGSNGLADNPGLSYSQLFQLAEDDKGVFAAVGLGWPQETRLMRLGAWLNTRSHTSVSGLAGDLRNYGLYGVFGQAWGPHALNVRVGVANGEVSIGSRFAAVAYRYRLREHALGVGAAHAFLSAHATASDLDDTNHVEIFGRFNLTPAVHLTFSLQRIENSGFQAARAGAGGPVVAMGLRVHYGF